MSQENNGRIETNVEFPLFFDYFDKLKYELSPKIEQNFY